jgi:hypothetical protein
MAVGALVAGMAAAGVSRRASQSVKLIKPGRHSLTVVMAGCFFMIHSLLVEY